MICQINYTSQMFVDSKHGSFNRGMH